MRFLEKPLINTFDEWVENIRVGLALSDEDTTEYALMTTTGDVDVPTLRCMVTYLALRLVTETPVKL